MGPLKVAVSVTAVPEGTMIAALDWPPPDSVLAMLTGVVDEVEDEVVDPVVLVVPVVELATAITGAMGLPVGAVVEIPEGTELFGYDVQVSVNGEPPTSSVRLVEESSSTVICEPVAVKGPSVVGDDGTVSVTPASGTGVGMSTLKFSVPVDSVAGVAPDTSSCPEAEPLSVGEMAAAALARVEGRLTEVW